MIRFFILVFASALLLLGVVASPSLAFAASDPTTTWFFAEGSTQPPFDTWFLVQNPTNQTATVNFTFQLQPSGTLTHTYTVGPNTRFSLFANQVLPNQAFSTRIDADQAVLAERAMYVGYDGTAVPGIAAPQTTWLFAEGSTQSAFQTWLLLQNPNNALTAVTVTYLLDQGAPVKQTLTLPPSSRTSIFVNQVLPNAAFASRVESDRPIVAERAMYRFPGNAVIAKAGVNAVASTWYFADGRSIQTRGQPADTWLLLQNPNSTPEVATITFFSSDGPPQTIQRTLPPASRASIFCNQVTSYLTYGIRVQATAPIIAERSVFVASPATGNEPRGAYGTIGATQLGTVWAFAEGSTAQPFRESIVILNPNDRPAAVYLDFVLPNGQINRRDWQVPPHWRDELDINAWVPDTAVSTLVTSDLPTVAERVMFWTKGGNMGFTDAVGVRLR